MRITCGHDRSFNYDYPSLAVVLQRLPQVCRKIHYEIAYLLDNSTLALVGFCHFDHLATELDNLGYDFTKVRVLIITTLKIREYIRYWVSSDL